MGQGKIRVMAVVKVGIRVRETIMVNTIQNLNP